MSHVKYISIKKKRNSTEFPRGSFLKSLQSLETANTENLIFYVLTIRQQLVVESKRESHIQNIGSGRCFLLSQNRPKVT